MTRQCFLVVLLGTLLLLPVLYQNRCKTSVPPLTVLPTVASPVAAVDPIMELDNGRWTRSFMAADGTLYLWGRLQSRDGGRTIEPQTAIDVEKINAAPERAVFTRPGMFYALDGPAELESPGVYRVRGWRSTDDLLTLSSETVRLEVPAGPSRARQPHEWYGLYVYRTILEMPDGSWRLTMYGNFDVDTLPPLDRSSQQETKYMMRAFILISRDQGSSWQYLATIAAPQLGDPVGEGFVEPALTRLSDGRLLCILRTGHYYPLYASWSSDGGISWTAPVYTGLDRGCDPCLITLVDGRVALSWGRRFPETWSTIDSQGDAARFKYPGVGVVNLAISSDGGATWVNTKVAQRGGSCYSTIFEMAPNIIFLQVEQRFWRVTIQPLDARAPEMQ